jgi:lipoate-protein ligase A
MTKPDTWRLLPFSDAPMGRQLALSEAMLAALDETGAPALRWYIPTERALVLGNGQPLTVADHAALAAQATALYKRTSGGTAVLVDETLLSFDIALPHSHQLATTDVVHAYEWVGDLWAAALRSLGVTDARAIPTADVRALTPLAKDDPLRLACYGTLSPWEVVSGHKPRKLVGLCQVRRRAGTLYQVGAYLRFDAAALASLLALAPDTHATLTTHLSCAAIGLDEAAGRAISAQRVIAAVQRELRASHNAGLTRVAWLPIELNAADQLEAQRFARLA